MKNFFKKSALAFALAFAGALLAHHHMKAYRITQWETEHESHESRKITYGLTWVKKPNKHDGLTYRHIVKQEDRTDLYAAWSLILEVCSKSKRVWRGWLVRNGVALTALDLELMTGFPEGIFERALTFYSQPHIGWLKHEDFPENLLLAADPAGNGPALPAAAPGTPAAPPDNPPILGRIIREVGSSSGADAPKKKSSKTDVQQSRTQWAATSKRIKELKGRAGELNQQERDELMLLEGLLERLERKQARGDFSTEDEK